MSTKLKGTMVGLSLGILLGTAPLAVMTIGAQGVSSPPVPPTASSTINRSLPGARDGLLTKYTGQSVVINGISYTLAPGCQVGTDGGSPYLLDSLKGNSISLVVRYWLGSGDTHNQVTQLLVRLPQ
jgi:hypothetical protein